MWAEEVTIFPTGKDVVTFINFQWEAPHGNGTFKKCIKNALYLYNTKIRHFNPVIGFKIHFYIYFLLYVLRIVFSFVHKIKAIVTYINKTQLLMQF